MRILKICVALLGRIALSAIFIAAGIRVLLNWQSAEQLLSGHLCDGLALTLGNETLQHIFEIAIPFSFLLLVVSVFCMLAGGLLMIIGPNVRFGAFLALLFLIPQTLLFHHFWTFIGTERFVQEVSFIKNVSIGGGLLLLLAHGRGNARKGKARVHDDEMDDDI